MCFFRVSVGISDDDNGMRSYESDSGADHVAAYHHRRYIYDNLYSYQLNVRNEIVMQQVSMKSVTLPPIILSTMLLTFFLNN